MGNKALWIDLAQDTLIVRGRKEAYSAGLQYPIPEGMYGDRCIGLIGAKYLIELLLGVNPQPINGHQHIPGGQPPEVGRPLLMHGAQIESVRTGLDSGLQSRMIALGLPLQGNTLSGQQLLERQIITAISITGDVITATHSGGGLDEGRHLVLANAFGSTPKVVLAKVLPQITHHIIETAASIRAGLTGKVEPHGHQGARGIVADDGIGRVFILLVKAGAGDEGAGGDGLLASARDLTELGNGPLQTLEIGALANGGSAPGEQPIVRGAQALKRPKLMRVVGAQ